MDLIVKNATVVTAADVIEDCAIGVKDGVVVWIVNSAHSEALSHGCTNIVDAAGGFVTPGAIDAHTHIEQEKGIGAHAASRSADDWDTATASALAGGTTTVVAFAVQTRDCGILEAIDEYRVLAEQKARSDFSMHCIVTDTSSDQLGHELATAIRDRGVSSVKLYMTYDALKLSDRQVLKILHHARTLGITTMVHAENDDCVNYITEDLIAQGLKAPHYHGVSRPPLVEAEATNRAVALAELMDTPILLVHVSAPGAIDHIRQAQTRLLPIHGETCASYVTLDGSLMRQDHFEGAKYVCSPPLRDNDADREKIWEALSNGTFTIVSSDHAPTNFYDEHGKRVALHGEGDETGDFRHIPNGLPGIEVRVPLMWSEGVLKGRFSMQRFVELTSANPAKLYGMYPQKGTIAPGSDADFIIWRAPEARTQRVLTNSMLHHGVDYTPHEGFVLEDWPSQVFLRGRQVFDLATNEVTAPLASGQFVRRGKSCLAGPRNVWVNEWRPSSIH